MKKNNVDDITSYKYNLNNTLIYYELLIINSNTPLKVYFNNYEPINSQKHKRHNFRP